MSDPKTAARARHETLVRLAMEAFDSTLGGRFAIETAVRERMAQAAQAWTLEVDADALRALDEAQARANALQDYLDKATDRLRCQEVTVQRLVAGLAEIEAHNQSAVEVCRDLQGRKAGDRG